MSHAATFWALDASKTGPLSPVARLVLIVLADYTDPDGRGAWPALSTVYGRLGMSESTAHRAIVELRDAGAIVRGDQRLIPAHIPKGRRPTVWDLPIKATRPSDPDPAPDPAPTLALVELPPDPVPARSVADPGAGTPPTWTAPPSTDYVQAKQALRDKNRGQRT